MIFPWRWYGIWLGLYLLFILQSTLFHWLVPAEWLYRISPQFVLVTILFIALYTNRYFAMLLGLVFGLLHDVLFYGHMVGLYTFAMGLVAYLAGKLFQKQRLSFFPTLALIAAGCLTFDFIVYLLYRLFRVVDAGVAWALFHHIVPSLIVNLFFAIVVYIPYRRYLEALTPMTGEEEDEGG